MARYAWASPTSLLGLLLALLTWITGGSLKRRNGVLEVTRGLSRSVLESPRMNAGAITLGHVIAARDARSMTRYRVHELGHVRQAEILGPFFLPAYFASAVAARLRGGHFYHDNWFERDAERRAGAIDAEGRLLASQFAGKDQPQDPRT